MKLSVLSLIGHAPHPLNGRRPSPAERFEEVIETGVVAERLGFDAYSIGERHAGPFLHRGRLRTRPPRADRDAAVVRRGHRSGGAA
ncbi:Luciferase-like monooxygenase [Streptomyces sp. Ncost-T10-10d]|nr:Luciferase-like monooxygenase [Streptomyces sp. Ncost-T10-10d]